MRTIRPNVLRKINRHHLQLLPLKKEIKVKYTSSPQHFQLKIA